MADNKRPTRSEDWRKKIQTSMLVNRLYSNALGELPKEMTQGQIKSAEILLRKTIPDLKSVEMGGIEGGAIQVQVVDYSKLELDE